MANAGIDQSNVESDDNSEQVLLLPRDPDKSAFKIREKIKREIDVNIGVIINDSVGRAWRNGTIGTAIGISGIPAIIDFRGQPDLFGKPLRTSQEAISDELSSAASLLQGQASEGMPVVIIKGYLSSKISPQVGTSTGISDLIRPRDKDLFR